MDGYFEKMDKREYEWECLDLNVYLLLVEGWLRASQEAPGCPPQGSACNRWRRCHIAVIGRIVADQLGGTRMRAYLNLANN